MAVAGWVLGLVSIACLGGGLVHLARVVVVRSRIPGELCHAAMAVGMAAMFSPLGDPLPRPVWTVVFALGLVWFGAGAVRGRTLAGDAGHHAVGCAAMLLMLAAGHGAHGRGAAGALGVASVAALALTGYFAWHTLRCADRCRRADLGPGAAPATLRTHPLADPRLAAGGQLVTAAAMSVMLLGMV